MDDQPKAITYAQFAAMIATTEARIQLGRGVGKAGTGHRANAHRTPIGAPNTKILPAAAARGLAANAVSRSPSRNVVAARVVPQVGQGIPVRERNTQGRR